MGESYVTAIMERTLNHLVGGSSPNRVKKLDFIGLFLLSGCSGSAFHFGRLSRFLSQSAANQESLLLAVPQWLQGGCRRPWRRAECYAEPSAAEATS